AGTLQPMAPPREPRGRGRKPQSGRPNPGRKGRPEDDQAGPKHWGSVARRGAGRLNDDRPPGAAAAFREAAGLQDRGHETETWVRVDDDVRVEAAGAIARGRRTPNR